MRGHLFVIILNVLNLFFRSVCCHHPWKGFSGCPQSRTPVCRNPKPKLHRLHRQRKDFGSKTGCAKTRLIFTFYPLTVLHISLEKMIVYPISLTQVQFKLKTGKGLGQVIKDLF